MPDFRAVSDADLARDLVEIQAAFDTWAGEGRMPVPGCLRDQLGPGTIMTPALWLTTLCGHRDRIGWEQMHRAARA